MDMIFQGRSTSVFQASDDIVVGFEDAVREPVVAHVLPDVFNGIEFRAFRRQGENGDVGGNSNLADRCHPAWSTRRTAWAPGAIALAISASAGSSLRYCRRAGSEPRRCPVSGRWRQRYRSMRFADPAECSGKCRAWPTSRVILFFWPIRASSLEPNFYLADVDRFFARDFIQARWELFLKSSIAPSACA